MTPPRFADRLLEFFCAPDRFEEIQGDLHEEFVYQVRRMGERRARWRYVWDVIGFIRPFAMKRKSEYFTSTPLLTPTMLLNYLKIAWRNISRNQSFSVLNMLGLGLGMSCAIVIFLVIKHETSYDQYQSKGSRIYRVENENISEGHTYPGVYTGMPTALRHEVPELETIVPIFQMGGQSLLVPATGNLFKESVVYVGNEFVHLLDFEWLSGDAQIALSQPNTVVLTDAYARKFFGTSEVLGQTIRIANKQDLQVVGVLKDYPATTSFPFDILISFSSVKNVNSDYDLNKWNGWSDNFQVFVLLKPNIQPEQVTKRFPALIDKYMGKDALTHKRLYLNPLAKIHYTSNMSGRTANVKLLNILALIGTLVLLIACINFINLTTAQAFKRAKEIGIRKSIGSNRLSLVYQFLTEAGLTTLSASLLSVLVVWTSLPSVATMMGLQLTAMDLFSWQTSGFLGVLFVTTTSLAGVYPAFRLSGMAPIWALKNNRVTTGRQWITVRQGLVVVQFTVSFILISSTLLINKQLSFFQNADLGFNKTAIITVRLSDNRPEKLQTLRSQLLQIPQVKDVSFSLNSASTEGNWMQLMQYRKGTSITDIKTQMKFVDAHFIDTYGIQLITGEAFREGDTLPKLIANEVFLHRMGISRPEAAIGQSVYFGDGQESAPIIGVVKTFNVNSLHQKIDPTLLMVYPKNFYQGSIKLQNDKLTAGSLKATLVRVEKIWTTAFPNQLFEYSFLDESLAQAYKSETQTSQLIETSTFLAILIACLGLFGLATFSAEQRTKEIGVRKVLGASVTSIVALLSKDFLKPVLVAVILALPVARYAMNQWLQNFEFHTDLSWWVFALAGGLGILIAFLTVSFQSIKAALMNPVKSLRSE